MLFCPAIGAVPDCTRRTCTIIDTFMAVPAVPNLNTRRLILIAFKSDTYCTMLTSARSTVINIVIIIPSIRFHIHLPLCSPNDIPHTPSAHRDEGQLTTN
eukprot:SAG11_NODE_1286_length_5299_cov_18.976923_5_plen_100_part_00